MCVAPRRPLLQTDTPMKLIASVISAVITLTASLAGIIVLVLVAHVTIDVVMRFAFDTPLNSTILYVSAF